MRIENGRLFGAAFLVWAIIEAIFRHGLESPVITGVLAGDSSEISLKGKFEDLLVQQSLVGQSLGFGGATADCPRSHHRLLCFAVMALAGLFISWRWDKAR